MPTTPGARPSASDPVVILYTNWRGETAVRRIIVSDCADDGHCTALRHGSTEWHSELQWLFSALDVDKGVERTFALSGIKAWGQEAVDAALAPPAAVPDEVRRPSEDSLYGALTWAQEVAKTGDTMRDRLCAEAATSALRAMILATAPAAPEPAAVGSLFRVSDIRGC